MTSRPVGIAGMLGIAVWLSYGANVAAQVTFTARTDVVTVDVAVRQGGQVVRGLRADDFEVVDNGVRQKVNSARFDDVPAHVVLALDMSRSVRGATLDDLRAAITRIIGLLAPDDAVAVMAFSDRVVPRSPFTTDRAALESSLTLPLPSGDTALRDAVFTSLVLGDDRPGRVLVLVFSDGADTGSFLDADAVLQAARRTRAVVYGITSGSAGHDGFLNDVSSLTGGYHVVLSAGGNVADAIASAFVDARQRYLLTYTPRDVELDGWHELSVRVPSLPGAEIEARPGYLVSR